jgi:hypothetical protein
VIDKADRVDISFNAVGIPGTKILGVPLVELDVEYFSLPITAYTTSYFLIGRLAARRMVANKSGVIMTATTQHSRIGIPLSGGYGPAMAAEEDSLDCYPPSSHPMAFGWLVCDHRPYQRQPRSRKHSRFAPRYRE